MAGLRFCCALLAGFLAGAVPALADDPFTPRPAERLAIADCLSSARAAADRPDTCIGVVADPCMETDEGITTLGMTACASREADIWDELLNQHYQTARSVLPEAASTGLRDVQRLWIEYRDAKCAFPRLQFEGGTIAGPISAYCVMEMTARRALELADIADMP